VKLDLYNVLIIVVVMVFAILKLVYVPVMSHGLDKTVEPDICSVLWIVVIMVFVISLQVNANAMKVLLELIVRYN
jgi:quinol-cytochrome oxidoreductase complex cytochrome b subunit